MRSLIGIAAIASLLLLSGCNQHDEQRDFEQQALSPPSGLTETDFNGQATGVTDSDDWRISPFYQGLVEITPAFPNPALTTDDITIEVFVTGVEPVTGLYLFVFNHLTGSFPSVTFEEDTYEFGSISLRFNGSDLSTVNNGAGLYRVILQDATNNIISYGDIEVE